MELRSLELTGRGALVEGLFGASNARTEWRARRCLHLTLVDDEGVVGEGEASPLPAYSPDSLEEARASLEGLCLGELRLERFIARPLEGASPAPPSASFALEIALLDWAARRTGDPLTLPPRHPTLPMAALVDMGDAEASAAAALAAGYPVLKLKLGRDLDGELALARSLAGRGVRLRFDANGSLRPAELPRVLRTLEALDAEMLEEPCAGPWPTDSAVPLAVDESLATDRPAALERLASGQARRAVVKPMLIGGPSRVRPLVAQVEALGGSCVFGHAFGGPIERAAVGAMALAWSGRDAPAAGLAAHAGLTVWPAATTEAFEGVTVRANRSPGLGLSWSRR